MQVAAHTLWSDSEGSMWPTREKATAKQMGLFGNTLGALIDTLPIVLGPRQRLDLFEWLVANRHHLCNTITQLYPEFCDDDS